MMSDFINELFKPAKVNDWNYNNVVYALELADRSLDETLLNLGEKLEMWEGRLGSGWGEEAQQEVDGLKKETQDVLDAIDDLVNLKAHYKRVTGKSQVIETKSKEA